MYRKLRVALLGSVAAVAVASAGVAGTVTLSCTSPDPSMHPAVLQLDETQGTVILTWNDRVLPGGETKPAKEEGTFQGTFSRHSIDFDVNKGDQYNHYAIDRQTGSMTDVRYEMHHGHQENEGMRYWNCRPSGKAIF